MKYLRLFKTTNEYDSATLDLPNVSYIEDENIVYYNPNNIEYITVSVSDATGSLEIEGIVDSFTYVDVSIPVGTTPLSLWNMYCMEGNDFFHKMDVPPASGDFPILYGSDK